MGLTRRSVGAGAPGRERRGGVTGAKGEKGGAGKGERVIALAGNPNVGKSTVFNALTGLNQHTGNWAGKTVGLAEGACRYAGRLYRLVDLPGTYSLMAHSNEEEVARNYLCFAKPDAVVVVCDATCLCRNLNLVLQTLEITRRVIVCVNLMDEAARRGIAVDTGELSAALGVPVVGVTARKKKTLDALLDALGDLDISDVPDLPDVPDAPDAPVPYPPALEDAAAALTASDGVRELAASLSLPARFLAFRLLEGDENFLRETAARVGESAAWSGALGRADDLRKAAGISADAWRDLIVSSLLGRAEAVCERAVRASEPPARFGRADRILTGRLTAFPVMLLLLALVFFLTICGANLPSEALALLFAKIEEGLAALFARLDAPAWLEGALVEGVFRTLSRVVAVMLPPMAIFFPLFTLLEDAGYLPRVAFNLDRPFRACDACGKQALTMCMGFGCNAAGVVGCRIIDSPRERLLAILTNNFMPCNGRFPTLILLLSLFFVAGGVGGALASAGILTLLVLFAILVTFLTTKALSRTLFRGVPSSFTIEMPPYRRPQIGKVLVRSLLDRTLFVLGRAAVVAAPAGLLLWILANVTVADRSLLSHAAAFLDPAGRLFGMDGAILLAFLLGFPANEIVLPIVLMIYTADGSLGTLLDPAAMRELLTAHGWTALTALSVMLFSIFHFPCSTTLLTIKKETGSVAKTALAALLPTAIGLLLCLVVNLIIKGARVPL